MMIVVMMIMIMMIVMAVVNMCCCEYFRWTVKLSVVIFKIFIKYFIY